MGTRVKLTMPKKISSHPSKGSGVELIAPMLIIGDKEFKVVRTGYEYQGAIEVTIMVYANDLDIIAEKDNGN